jgi:hypothetical protein
MSVLRHVSLAGAAVSGLATLGYLGTAVATGQAIHHQPTSRLTVLHRPFPPSHSYIIAGVWSFMGLKWCAGLASFRS